MEFVILENRRMNDPLPFHVYERFGNNWELVCEAISQSEALCFIGEQHG